MNERLHPDVEPASPADEEARELLVAEATDAFIADAQAGLRPKIDEFAARYPQIAPVLRQLLPALRAMHDSSGPALSGGQVEATGFATTPTPA